VRGTLDQPPIIVTASLWKTFAYLAISFVFVLLGILMIFTEGAGLIVWVGWMWVAFFGLGTLVMIARTVAPPILTLSPDGVSCFTGLKTVQYGWRDVHNFRVFRVSLSTKMVGFDFRPDFPKHAGIRRLNKSVFGFEGAFGPGWRISNAALAELLDSARARWFVG